MKKRLFVLFFIMIVVLSVSACGKKENKDASSIAKTDAVNSNYDSILSGNESTDTIWAKQDSVLKQEFVDAAKEEGLEVAFGSDGSTTMKNENGEEYVQNADGTWVFEGEDGSVGQYGGEWPENKFTKLVPKPDFSLLAAVTDENEFTVAFSAATIEGVRDYVEKVKSSGFTENASTEDQNIAGMVIYCYSASNTEGYTVEIVFSSGTSGMTISK